MYRAAFFPEEKLILSNNQNWNDRLLKPLISLPTRAQDQMIFGRWPEDTHRLVQLCVDGKTNRYMGGFDNDGLVIMYENEKLTRIKCDPQNLASPRRITALAFINENQIAAACVDQIFIFDTKTNACIIKLKGHTEEIRALAISSKGYLFSASLDQTVRIWDLKNARSKATFHGQEWITYLLPLSNGNVMGGTVEAKIIVLDDNGSCRMNNSAGDKPKWTSGIDWNGISHQHITGLIEYQDTVISSSRDGTIRVWTKDSLKLKQILRSPENPNERIYDIGAIDHYLIARTPSKICIWDMSTWECKKIILGIPMMHCYHLAVSKDEIVLTHATISGGTFYSMDDTADNKLFIIPLHTCLTASEDQKITFNSLLHDRNDSIDLNVNQVPPGF